ncbi:hypothetical protein ACUXEY_004617 [Bacillus sp. F9_6S_D1_P_5]
MPFFFMVYRHGNADLQYLAYFPDDSPVINNVKKVSVVLKNLMRSLSPN